MFVDHISDISVNVVITEPLVKHDKVKNHREKYQHERDSNPKTSLTSFARFFGHLVCLLYTNIKFKSECVVFKFYVLLQSFLINQLSWRRRGHPYRIGYGGRCSWSRTCGEWSYQSHRSEP